MADKDCIETGSVHKVQVPITLRKRKAKTKGVNRAWATWFVGSSATLDINNVHMYRNHPTLVKCRSAVSELGSRQLCISNKLPGDVSDDGPQTTL
jgi:hypothetical protein